MAGVALLLDVAVCLPFIYDPLGWLEPTLAAPGGADRTEYLVFLGGGGNDPARTRFFAAHPELRVEHEGGWAGTIVVSLPASAQDLAGELRGQPFVRLMTRSGTTLCRAI